MNWKRLTKYPYWPLYIAAISAIIIIIRYLLGYGWGW